MNCLFLTVVYSDTLSYRTSRYGRDASPVYVVSKNAVSSADRGPVERNHRYVRAVSDTSIDKLHVVTRVSSRFAQTNVESTIMNPGHENREATFLVQLPDTAFISNFTMTIDDEMYVAAVKEKAEADEEYEEARRQNRTAGIVDARPPPEERNMQVFAIAINVRANSSAHVVLTYQQLLQRRLGLFELVTSIRPNQLVGDLSVRIHLHEPQGIQRLYVVEPGQETTNSVNAVDTVIEGSDDFNKVVTYNPSLEAQRRLNILTGVACNFVVRYDVTHTYDAGLLQLDNGYFVHFFSPQGLNPLGKNIVFVIDISGSMQGNKMVQTRDAMMTILDQLRTDDRFLMLLFDDSIRFWPSSKTMVLADTNIVHSAKKFARDNLKATGGTDINGALISAASLLRNFKRDSPSMILFLTDGHPSVGVTVRETIVDNVMKATGSHVSIFSLGFGQNLDYVLLQSISQRTGGFARRIYEGIDARVQLQDLFLEIGTPLLYDVRLAYNDNVVDTNTLTRVAFPQYFNGSELAVAGKLLSNHRQELVATVTGTSSAPVTLTKNVNSSATPADRNGMLERLYIHMKIKDLLREKLLTDNETEQNVLDKYIIRLAIDYNLVTPLTSMIIVQRDTNDGRRLSEDAYAGFTPTFGNSGTMGYGSHSVLVVSAGFLAIAIHIYHMCLQ